MTSAELVAALAAAITGPSGVTAAVMWRYYTRLQERTHNAHAKQLEEITRRANEREAALHEELRHEASRTAVLHEQSTRRWADSEAALASITDEALALNHELRQLLQPPGRRR